MLTILGCTDLWIFRHLDKHVFRRAYFGRGRGSEARLFFLKCWKLNGDFRTAAKNGEKIFGSLDNPIWISFFKISLLSRAYLSSGVSVLTNGLKILDTTKTDIFELKFSQNEGKIQWNYCGGDCSRI